MTDKNMTVKNPAKIQNDLPDVEKRVELKKHEENIGTTGNAKVSSEEDAVEKAIEKLPAK